MLLLIHVELPSRTSRRIWQVGRKLLKPGNQRCLLLHREAAVRQGLQRLVSRKAGGLCASCVGRICALCHTKVARAYAENARGFGTCLRGADGRGYVVPATGARRTGMTLATTDLKAGVPEASSMRRGTKAFASG